MINTDKVLCFNLGSEEFAVPLLNIKEVIAQPDVTPLPQSPNYFLGIINLRGQIISIIDLRVKFNIKPMPNSESAVMILDFNGQFLGVVVDKVNSVQSVKENDIAEKPSVDNSKTHDYIEGVFKRDDKLIFLLDISKSLSLDDKNRMNNATKKAA